MRGLLEAQGDTSRPGFWKWWLISVTFNSFVLFLYGFGLALGATIAWSLIS